MVSEQRNLPAAVTCPTIGSEGDVGERVEGRRRFRGVGRRGNRDAVWMVVGWGGEGVRLHIVLALVRSGSEGHRPTDHRHRRHAERRTEYVDESEVGFGGVHMAFCG